MRPLYLFESIIKWRFGSISEIPLEKGDHSLLYDH